MIPRYKGDEGKPEFTARQVDRSDVFDLVAGEAIVLVMKIGWNERDQRPIAKHATPARFLEFLRTKDPTGVLRKFVADELEMMAKHWRSGDVLKDGDGTFKED